MHEDPVPFRQARARDLSSASVVNRGADSLSKRLTQSEFALGFAPGDRDTDADPDTGHIVLDALAEILHAAMVAPEKGRHAFVRHVELALQAYVHPVAASGDRPLAATSGGLAAWQLRKAQALVEPRLDEPVSVAELAQACRISQAHFARAFKQSTGMSPQRWIIEHRVEQAKWQLINTDSPLAQIAQSCGFGVQSNFTRVFTRIAGISPGAWRRAFAGPAIETE